MFPVAALKMNETLRELFIGENKMTATDGVQIGNLLKYNHRLELLDLRNNHLQVGFAYQHVSCFCWQFPYLMPTCIPFACHFIKYSLYFSGYSKI